MAAAARHRRQKIENMFDPEVRDPWPATPLPMASALLPH